MSLQVATPPALCVLIFVPILIVVYTEGSEELFTRLENPNILSVLPLPGRDMGYLCTLVGVCYKWTILIKAFLQNFTRFLLQSNDAPLLSVPVNSVFIKKKPCGLSSNAVVRFKQQNPRDILGKDAFWEKQDSNSLNVATLTRWSNDMFSSSVLRCQWFELLSVINSTWWLLY